MAGGGRVVDVREAPVGRSTKVELLSGRISQIATEVPPANAVTKGLGGGDTLLLGPNSSHINLAVGPPL